MRSEGISRDCRSVVAMIAPDAMCPRCLSGHVCPECYEIGYRDGANSGFAVWVAILDVLPFEVKCPEDVIEGVRALGGKIE